MPFSSYKALLWSLLVCSWQDCSALLWWGIFHVSAQLGKCSLWWIGRVLSESEKSWLIINIDRSLNPGAWLFYPHANEDFKSLQFDRSKRHFTDWSEWALLIDWWCTAPINGESLSPIGRIGSQEFFYMGLLRWQAGSSVQVSRWSAVCMRGPCVFCFVLFYLNPVSYQEPFVVGVFFLRIYSEYSNIPEFESPDLDLNLGSATSQCVILDKSHSHIEPQFAPL